MKTMKKSLIVFGAIATALLMISGVTAITVTQPNQVENVLKSERNESVEVENEVYVDPDIYLTTDDLPTLYKALQYIDEPEYRQIVQEIINLIESPKGYADSNDIKAIIDDSGIGITAIYGLSTIRTAEISDGYAICFPGLLRPGFLPRKALWARYFTKDDWNAVGWHLTINDLPVGKGSGRILGFYGILRFWRGYYLEPIIQINGAASLIFHTNLNNQNSQSNPSSNQQSSNSPQSSSGPSGQQNSQNQSSPTNC